MGAQNERAPNTAFKHCALSIACGLRCIIFDHARERNQLQQRVGALKSYVHTKPFFAKLSANCRRQQGAEIQPPFSLPPIFGQVPKRRVRACSLRDDPSCRTRLLRLLFSGPRFDADFGLPFRLKAYPQAGLQPDSPPQHKLATPR
jgi:hypothetical protein